ncbi:MAG: nitrate reductase associated protein [Pseudanabaenaceae cyanobacterium bins.68]|nr:nitrate reductase associated protein [Pseudanabaenaceae cyanobacterium bins.68]
MSGLFKFEQDFAASLRCIPMVVRYKLDHCGVKLKLVDWLRLDPSDRQILVDTPANHALAQQQYRHLIARLIAPAPIQDLAIAPNPAWQNLQALPEPLTQKLLELGLELGLAQWQQLSDLQRFVLIKLCRAQHENHNFVPALLEFGLLEY